MRNRLRGVASFALDGFISNPVNCLRLFEFPPWLALFGIFPWAAFRPRRAARLGNLEASFVDFYDKKVL
jgi:hypothetical protein